MAAVPEEPAEVVAVKPDPEAGTPPQPPAAPPATAAPPAPSAAAAEGEAAGSAGDASSAKPSAPGPAASPAALDRQTLVAVLQFLRRSNLRESEEILRREARLLGEDLGAAALSPAGAGLPGASGGEGDASSSEALLSRVTAAAAIAIGSSVAPVASSSPGVAAATAVPPGKGETRSAAVGGVPPGGSWCASRCLGAEAPPGTDKAAPQPSGGSVVLAVPHATPEEIVILGCTFSEEGTEDRVSVLLAGTAVGVKGASRCLWVPFREHHERLKILFVVRGDGCRHDARAPMYKLLRFKERAIGYSWRRFYAFLLQADSSFRCSSDNASVINFNEDILWGSFA